MSEGFNYFECDQCGHIGKLQDLVDHPTRPMPEDLGFCPDCKSEVREVLTEQECRDLLAEYDEDFDQFFKERWS